MSSESGADAGAPDTFVPLPPEGGSSDASTDAGGYEAGTDADAVEAGEASSTYEASAGDAGAAD